MNELTLPLRMKVKIGKTETKHPFGSITIKTKYKIGLAVGLFWLSFKIFFMGIKRLID